MTARTAFADELRRARERRGLSLEAIAEQTKVSVTIFAGLERGDLSRWPSGIFRRAFIRAYATAIGLDPEDTVARFSALFHDPTEEPRPSHTLAFRGRTDAVETASAPAAQPALAAPAPSPTDESPGSRLVLDQERSARTARDSATVKRLLSGMLDVSVALLPAAVVALAGGMQWFWPVVGCVAMTGHLACYASIGTTPGAWLMSRLAAPPPPVLAPRVERRRVEPEESAAPRRRVSRHQSSRPAPHIHRVRH